MSKNARLRLVQILAQRLRYFGGPERRDVDPIAFPDIVGNMPDDWLAQSVIVDKDEMAKAVTQQRFQHIGQDHSQRFWPKGYGARIGLGKMRIAKVQGGAD